jgi:hypothetical protein
MKLGKRFELRDLKKALLHDIHGLLQWFDVHEDGESRKRKQVHLKCFVSVLSNYFQS